MNLGQLQKGLEQAFFSENHHLVFWYDPEQSFADELVNLDLQGVQVLDMSGESSLAIKLKLELEDQNSRYLLYFPHAEPEPEDD